MSIPPWHMWGNSVGVTLHPGQVLAKQQLARISYKRPESWRFLFFAQILRSQITSTLNPVSVIVTFDVTTGVGRSSITMNNFELFVFSILVSGEQGASNPKFSTEVFAPARSDLETPPLRTTIDSLVGQDIQIGYNAVLEPGPPNLPATDEAQVQVGVLFAPWHHARPDWFAHEFTGEELRGT